MKSKQFKKLLIEKLLDIGSCCDDPRLIIEDNEMLQVECLKCGVVAEGTILSELGKKWQAAFGEKVARHTQ